MKFLQITIDKKTELKNCTIGSADEELSIQVFIWVKLDENDLVITEIHANGYTEKHKYKWLNEIYTGKETLRFEIVDNTSYDQPIDTSPKKKPSMPTKAKLKLYQQLKKELTEKGLI